MGFGGLRLLEPLGSRATLTGGSVPRNPRGWQQIKEDLRRLRQSEFEPSISFLKTHKRVVPGSFIRDAYC